MKMSNHYDVIIVGGGIAGLYTALHLDPKTRILLLAKRDIMLCNSDLAQGGVAAVTDPDHDTIESHIHDTLVAGGFTNDPDSTRVLVENGPADVLELLDYGVDFDRKTDGGFHRTLEGGHTHHRILHYKDCTGHEITQKLVAAVEQLENVTMLEYAMVCDTKKVEGGFWVNVCQDGKFTAYSAEKLVLATGGIGRVYAYTTNSKIATGDGLAFAYRMGAVIKNLHLVQFHPTAFNNRHTRECFLISEAVRGEGAYLLNCHKERFMDRYDERLELAPRDVVSRCIVAEQEKTGSDAFYLDISYKDPEFVKNRFPMIYANVLKAGYDMTKEPIPIYPCQHYLMGGIDVDTYGRTNLPGLYACGECAHTGVHGNNRLASNSLLEALVFSHRIAENINAEGIHGTPIEDYTFPSYQDGEPIPTGIRTEVRQIMQKAHFVVPNREEAEKGLVRVTAIKEQLDHGNYRMDKNYLQARSLATVAYIILKEVVQGKEVAE